MLCIAAAVVNSGVEGADEKAVTKVMSAIADRVVHEFVEPFTFPNRHQRILEPYNYYEFGQVRAHMCLSLQLCHSSQLAW